MPDLSREGPFDVHQDCSTSGASPRVLNGSLDTAYISVVRKVPNGCLHHTHWSHPFKSTSGRPGRLPHKLRRTIGSDTEPGGDTWHNRDSCCQYRMTSYDEENGGPDFNPAYGIHLRSPEITGNNVHLTIGKQVLPN